MKFLQFAYKYKPDDLRIGYIQDNCVVDINARDPSIPKTMLGFLQEDIMWKLKEFDKRPCCLSALKDVIIKKPIHGMDKVFSSTFNYLDLLRLSRTLPLKFPCFFSKFSSCIIGPDEPLRLRTNISEKIDYEVELAVVIGKKALYVKAEDALDYVFGCTVVQDISSRDWQREKNGGQYVLGKSMDTFCPMGPWIVTLDEMGDLNNLGLKCTINGIVRQRSNTSLMYHKIPAMIERLSLVMTLLPGDVILTGTPAGGSVYHDPPCWLKPGDFIQSEVENIGVLETHVVKYEPPFKFAKRAVIKYPY